MSLEQRLKGLQGRTAAIETRLSGSGNASPASLDVPVEDFVPALECPVMLTVDQRDVPGNMNSSRGITSSPGSIVTRQPTVHTLDTTGLIAGAILVGAGFLLFAGNVELIKNPLVAIGCGIVLLGSVLVRIVI